MNISLSEKMKKFVQSKVDSGDYNNASEYIRDLIRQEERKTWAIARLNEELQKGYDSGISEDTPYEALDKAFSRKD